MLIKKLILVLFLISTNYGFSQNQTLELKDKELAIILSKANNDPENASLLKEKFGNELLKTLTKYPESLKFEFSEINKTKACYIRTSRDRKFRVYSWDSDSGGSMHFFDKIIQYQSGAKIFTELIKIQDGDAGTFCSKVYTLQIDKLTYYLTIENGIYSNKDASQSVAVIRISQNKIVNTDKIFKAKSKLLSRIDVNFDFFSVVDRPERPVELITFDEGKSILTIPVVNKDDQVTTKNIVYQLKGKYLEFLGVK